MNSPGAAAGLGLASAASWGGSDFVGGLGARRAPALLVVASGHIFSLFVLLAICIGMRLAVPGKHDLFYAALGGFEGSLALAVFYRALAMGAMGLTAALCGLLTALVPVLYSAAHEGLPSPLTGVGLAMGLTAIWLITHTPETPAAETPEVQSTEQIPEKLVALKGHDFSRAAKATESMWASAPEGCLPPISSDVSTFSANIEASLRAPSAATVRTSLLLGALAGVGFGTQLILFKIAGGGGALWAMTSARAAGVAALLIVLVVMPPKGPWRGFWLTGIVAGALDTIGNLFYFQASQLGRLDVAALVCSLYPAGTILLAALVLREWPTRRQVAGIALALCAVVLLSV